MPKALCDFAESKAQLEGGVPPGERGQGEGLGGLGFRVSGLGVYVGFRVSVAVHYCS